MAVNDTDMEKESGNGWEKFLMISIPIVFTVVLLGVLLTLFNVDIRNNALELAQKIPFVKNWVPDPVLDPEKEKLKSSEKQVESAEATIEKLKSQVTAKDAEIKAAKEAAAAETQKTADLQKNWMMPKRLLKRRQRHSRKRKVIIRSRLKVWPKCMRI